eukprot:920594-Rhodomonas_salina.1
MLLVFKVCVCRHPHRRIPDRNKRRHSTRNSTDATYEPASSSPPIVITISMIQTIQPHAISTVQKSGSITINRPGPRTKSSKFFSLMVGRMPDTMVSAYTPTVEKPRARALTVYAQLGMAPRRPQRRLFSRYCKDCDHHCRDHCEQERLHDAARVQNLEEILFEILHAPI